MAKVKPCEQVIEEALEKLGEKEASTKTQIIMSNKYYNKFTKQIYSKERWVPGLREPSKRKPLRKNEFSISSICTSVGLFNILIAPGQKEDFFIN